LRLNTGRQFSHLPKRPYPSGTPTFPTRDQVIDHLERHANEDGIERRLGCTAQRLDRANGQWRLTTSTGAVEAPQVVVGPGCSGMEIAYDLATGGAAKVWLAARSPPNIMLREGPGGIAGDFIAAIRDESVEIERGWPTSTGEQPTADGLRFIGFVPRASQIGFAAKQARRAAKAIARELQTGTA